MTWKQILRDFLRGFGEKDIYSLKDKLERNDGLKPGSTIYLTNEEAAALGELYRRQKLIAILDGHHHEPY